MRMRLKKHLDERIENVSSILLHQEGDEFFTKSEEERHALLTLPQDIFGNNHPLYLELGCGKGTFAIQSAIANPDINYIALEKLSNVIVVGCEEALGYHLDNLRFLNIRAENTHYHLPPKCAQRIYLNFSCPFPKKTYANRRLTSKNFLSMYKVLLTDDGEIWQKTDNKDFFDFSKESLVENGFEVFDDMILPADYPGNIVTEYEAKFRELGKPIYCLKARIAK